MSSLIHIITPRKRMDHHDPNSGERMLIAHQTRRLSCQLHNCSIYSKKNKKHKNKNTSGRVGLWRISAIHLPFVSAHYSIGAATSTPVTRQGRHFFNPIVLRLRSSSTRLADAFPFYQCGVNRAKLVRGSDGDIRRWRDIRKENLAE